MMHSPLLPLAAAACILLASGCQSNETIIRRPQLAALHGKGPLTILTKDTTRYQLESFAVTDSELSGSGTVTRRDVVTPFTGSIPFTEVSYIQRPQTDAFKTIIALTAGTFTAYYFLSSTTGDANMSASGLVTYHGPYTGGGGSSCPYIYSVTGAGRTLEGEAFGVAWGKGLEFSTLHVLSHASEESGSVRMIVTNERPETHYHNAVALYAVTTGEGVSVVADPEHHLWPVSHLLGPLKASDRYRRDVLESLARIDGAYWTGDLPDRSPSDGFEDEIEIELPRPPQAAEGSLVIRAINTPFIEVVLERLTELLGDDQLEFAQALDSDPELIGCLRDWTRESSLRVSLWDGNRWCDQGEVLPEATQVPFTRLVRIQTGAPTSDVVRVRLRALADVWAIDAVGIDWTDASPLSPVRCPLIRATGPGGAEVSPQLNAADNLYVTVLPGGSIELAFRGIRCSSREKTTYAFADQGYLHEWLKSAPPRVIPAVAGSWGAKLAFLKTLLRMKNLLLPPIYDRWQDLQAEANKGDRP